MKIGIGTRITITTVTLVMLTLGLYGLVSVRVRRAELEADLERQTTLVGNAVQVALEAALKDGRLFQDVDRLVARWQAAEPSIGLAYYDLANRQPGELPPAFRVIGTDSPDGGVERSDYLPPSFDPTRGERLARLDVKGDSVGQHMIVDGRNVYALLVPIRDVERNVIGAIELTRDEVDAEHAWRQSVRVAVYAVLGLSAMLALLVLFTTRSGISSPL